MHPPTPHAETASTTPDVFSNRQFLQTEAILCPDVANTPSGQFDELDRIISEQEFGLRRLFDGSGLALELMEVYRTMPGTPEAARARRVLLRTASYTTMELYPQLPALLAECFVDGFADMVRPLDALADEHIDHEIVRSQFIIYNGLMVELGSRGLWTAEHSRGLYAVLRAHPRLAHLSNSGATMNPIHLEAFGLPPKTAGLQIPDEHLTELDGAEWLLQPYNVWRTAKLEGEHPGAVAGLHRQFGLRNFGVTTHEHLVRMHKQRDNPPRRTSLVFMASPGMDQAVMSSASAFEKMHTGMHADTDWFLFEYASVTELVDLLDDAYARWGGQLGQPGGIEEVPVISLLGHGKHDYIRVNERYEQNARKTVSEKLTLEDMRGHIAPRLARLSLRNTTMLMDSCDTAGGKGDNLAGIVAETTNRLTMAPEGYSVLSSAEFVARPSGELALRPNFIYAYALSGTDVYKWAQTGLYTYRPYAREA